MTNKFLSDGKKVSVIGKLNNEEWIVQEIFVTESGDEIPSGERFVTKHLHDEPVESWNIRNERKKLQELALRKETCEESIRELHSRIDSLKKEKKQKNVELEAKAEILRNVSGIEDTFKDYLEKIIPVITGTVKYVVRAYDYQFPSIYEFDKYIGSTWDDGDYSGIETIHIVLESKGVISYADGNDEPIHLYKTYDEVLEKVKEWCLKRIEESRFGFNYFLKCQELGITFCSETNQKITKLIRDDIEKENAYKTKKIKEHEDSILKDEKRLAILEDILKKVERFSDEQLEEGK